METILFLDHVGFTIVGEKISLDDKVLAVKNPAVLQSQPNQTGQLQVQLMPVLFREFLDSSVRNNGVVFKYPVDKIIVSDADLDTRLKQQYEQMFAPINAPATAGEGETIKLFDDETK